MRSGRGKKLSPRRDRKKIKGCPRLGRPGQKEPGKYSGEKKKKKKNNGGGKGGLYHAAKQKGGKFRRK